MLVLRRGSTRALHNGASTGALTHGALVAEVVEHVDDDALREVARHLEDGAHHLLLLALALQRLRHVRHDIGLKLDAQWLQPQAHSHDAVSRNG